MAKISCFASIKLLFLVFPYFNFLVSLLSNSYRWLHSSHSYSSSLPYTPFLLPGSKWPHANQGHHHIFTWISATAYGVVSLIPYSPSSTQASVCCKNVLSIMLLNCLKSFEGFPLYLEYNLNFFLYCSSSCISGLPCFFKLMAHWTLWCYIHFLEYAKICPALGVFLCLSCSLPTFYH